MRCNPARWLWGVIPVAMLSWIAFNWERPTIEADLARRSQEQLVRQGLDWAYTEFSGRDATLRGRANEEGEPRKALETVRDLWGVRVVEPRTDLMPKVDVFSWSASAAKGKLTLSGFVPNEAARKSILAVAKANYPKSTIEDAMKLARGAPRQDVWVSGASFALRQLAQMRRGSAEMTGVSLAIAGEALDTPSYKSIRTALNQLPTGIKLGNENVTPAIAAPFSWTATRSPDKLLLAGHVPSDADREQIFVLAKKLYRGVAVVDRLEIAGGAPDGWSSAVAVALEQLAALKTGSAETRDATLTLSGEAASEEAADGIRRTLRGSVPGTIQWTEKITYPEPEPEVQATSPDSDPDAAYAALKAQRDAEWLAYEARWAAAAEADAKRRAEEEAARIAALEAAEADARRRSEELALERRRREETEARQKADQARAREEADRAAAVAPAAQAQKAEADRCQELMRDAVQKGQILFKTDSAELDSRSRPTLDALSKIAAACPGARIEIAGHTDSDGSEESNLELSARRAQTVLAYLDKAGVDGSRLKGMGYGETRPIVPNTSASNKSKNRRIEFTVIPN